MTREQFEAITQWQRETFPGASPLSKIAHLKQEVEELRIDLAAGRPSRKSEFADCFMLLFGAAASDGMTYDDISACIDAKMEINKLRKWGTPDENGVVNHIKE